MKVNIPRANFTIQASHAGLLHQSPTHFKSKERNLTLLANEEAHSFLRSQQANRRSRKQLFRINYPITNLWNKQTVSRKNFFPWKASKKRKPKKKTKYDINVFFEFQTIWAKLVKPEKSPQTYLECVQ